jgi:hypothetical protein
MPTTAAPVTPTATHSMLPGAISSSAPSISVTPEEHSISPYTNGTSNSSDNNNKTDQSYMPASTPSVMAIATHSMFPGAISSHAPSISPKIEDETHSPSLRSNSGSPISSPQPLDGIKGLPPYAYPVLACMLLTLIALFGYCWARQRRSVPTSVLDETRPRKLYLHALDTSTTTFTVAQLNHDDNMLPVDEVDLTDCSAISDLSMRF